MTRDKISKASLSSRRTCFSKPFANRTERSRDRAGIIIHNTNEQRDPTRTLLSSSVDGLGLGDAPVNTASRQHTKASEAGAAGCILSVFEASEVISRSVQASWCLCLTCQGDSSPRAYTAGSYGLCPPRNKRSLHIAGAYVHTEKALALKNSSGGASSHLAGVA